MNRLKINFYKIAISLLVILIIKSDIYAQAQILRPNWQNMDLDADGIFGISTEKAYSQLLKGKSFVPVVIAVIDGGVDIEHEDLKDIIWINSREISNNKKDDDKNGYVDDIHGWNFMGSSKGSFLLDNAELVRSLRSELKKDAKSTRSAELLRELDRKRDAYLLVLGRLEPQRTAMQRILKNIGKEFPSLEELKFYKYTTETELGTLVYIVRTMTARNQNFTEFKKDFERRYKSYKNQVDGIWNLDYDPRKGNKEYMERFHGNGDVKGIEPLHGTHATGIIAGIRDNGKGANGIAGTARIMALRAVPEGDFLDEDMANAIRYAADNGAKVISMSMVKFSSPRKDSIDAAVKYAMSKDVLIVHAAGNEGNEEKTENGFPNRYYLDGGEAASWIEVGASGAKDDENLLALFSNYGKNTVDVFAPGVKIYSTYPDNQYGYESGTSMATPVVSGLAALIRGYYPKLTAIQVKDIILKSVKKIEHPVKNKFGKALRFSDLCASGGIVNAYEALKLAEKVSGV